jgi:hypothetical protein
MRREARAKAAECVGALQKTLNWVREGRLGDLMPDQAAVLGTANRQLEQETVFPYRDLLEPIRSTHESVLRNAITVLQQQAAEHRRQFSALSAQRSSTVSKAKEETTAAANKEKKLPKMCALNSSARSRSWLFSFWAYTSRIRGARASLRCVPW